MAKYAADEVMDAALQYIINHSTRLIVCSSQPANFAAVAAASLADVTVDSGDFAIANGDVSGRKVTVAQQSAIPIDSSGTATHVVLVNDTSPEMVTYVTTCTSQALTAGGTVTVPAWDIEIADPT